MAVLFKLTRKQIDAVEPLMEEARKAAEEEKPGMVIGQTDGLNIKVEFLPHSIAKKFAEKENGEIRTITRIFDS